MLFEELKRRNVFRVVAAYTVTAWLVVQVADIILDGFAAPPWVMRTLLISLAVGFPITAVLAWTFEFTTEGLKRDHGQLSDTSLSSKTGRKLDFAIIGVLSVAVVLLLTERFLFSFDDLDPYTERSIAVLPFVDMSPAGDQEYFSDGVTEEILNSLASLKQLRVAGRTSSFAFKGQNDDLRRIGDILGVAYVLEGSVRKFENRIRVTAQLIEVADGFHLWSETFERELEDVFAIQDDIAAAIQSELKVALLGEEASLPRATPTTPQAYDLYLLAKEQIRERNRPSLLSAADLLDQAIAIDDHYAPAYAQRAITVLLLHDRAYGEIPQEEAFRIAEGLLDRALTLDPAMAEGWAARGLLGSQQAYRAQVSGSSAREAEDYRAAAATALEKALSLNPSQFDARYWLSLTVAGGGDRQRSFEIARDLYAVDPLFAPNTRLLGELYIARGELSDAKALAERLLAFDPNHTAGLAVESARLQVRGHYAQAVTLAERVFNMNPSGARFLLEQAYGRLLEFERFNVQERGSPPPVVLDFLGQHREALEAATLPGKPEASLFEILNRQGRYQDIIDRVGDSAADVRSFVADHSGDGLTSLGSITRAQRQLGNTEAFEEAAHRYVKLANSLGWMAGADPPMLEPDTQLMSNRPDAALDELERLWEQRLPLQKILYDPTYSQLEGKPRFQALEASIRTHIDSERAKLDLPPVDYSRLCIRDHCAAQAQRIAGDGAADQKL